MGSFHCLIICMQAPETALSISKISFNFFFMKNFKYLVAGAALMTFLLVGCQQADDLGTHTNYTRTQIVEQIIVYPDSRLDIWEQVSPENQHEIWVKKLD